MTQWYSDIQLMICIRKMQANINTLHAINVSCRWVCLLLMHWKFGWCRFEPGKRRMQSARLTSTLRPWTTTVSLQQIWLLTVDWGCRTCRPTDSRLATFVHLHCADGLYIYISRARSGRAAGRQVCSDENMKLFESLVLQTLTLRKNYPCDLNTFSTVL